jgi:type VI secretion system protein ImpF
MAVFGLPDFTGLSSRDSNDRKNLIKSIESALRVFEPRFINLKVSLEEVNQVERGVKFRIQASLRLEPTPEPSVFDTVLQVGTTDFEVKELS